MNEPQARQLEPTHPRRIAMLIYPGVAPLDVAGPLQAFDVANFLAGRPVYEIITTAPTANPVPTLLGFALLPSCAMADLKFPVDTLLVSGGSGADAGTDPEIQNWLRAAAPRTRRFGSICTGAFALNAAGLIDGRRVATHWAFSDELAARNPGAVVDRDRIFVCDGNLYTSAGISAGIDLALGLIEEDHRRRFALNVARFLVLHLKRSGGQAQFSMQLDAQFSGTPVIEEIQSWCLDNLAQDLSLKRLAARARMSERSFLRRFRDATGQSPGEFVSRARLRAACELLEGEHISMAAVAQSIGYGSPAAMRRQFLKAIGVTPAQYRERFSVSPA